MQEPNLLKPTVKPVSGETDENENPKYDVYTMGQIRVEKGTAPRLDARVERVKKFYAQGHGLSVKSKKLQWTMGWTHIQATEELVERGFRSFADFFAFFIQYADPRMENGVVVWNDMNSAKHLLKEALMAEYEDMETAQSEEDSAEETEEIEEYVSEKKK